MARYDALLSSKEAADVLGISVSWLNRLCHSQTLTALFPEGKGMRSPRFFKESDVMAYLEIKDKELDIPTLATLTRQAYVTSRATELQLEQLLFYLGIDLPRLSLRKQDVMRLYVQVEDALDITHRDLKPDNIMKWARIFYAVGEEYLWLIEQLLEDDEPWGKLLELANAIWKEAPREEFNMDKPLASAYGFLDAGRKNLRNVAYFYIRNKHGPQTASLAFPVSHGDRDERIINLAFPDQR